MEITVIPPDSPLLIDRAWAIRMTIKSFKGRRNVEVHLFRPDWDSGEETSYDWQALVVNSDDPEGQCRRLVLEAFTAQERDSIVEYLKERYSTRLSAITCMPLKFPVPEGLPALCSVDESKNVGFIRFEKIPAYDLGIPLRGLYNLDEHPPIVE
ncbi:hypothetical protein [Desulfovibrio oxyclinae]|uniref:hypothetical protein n=1 Tax=Desulfovibrio oxyclinae TaxID=63560 RepID=UPI00037A70E1|nr:hypothetical protein [Desulfovibrio oxyclinae]